MDRTAISDVPDYRARCHSDVRAQRSIRLLIRMLTVTSDGNTLEELEAVGALPSRDLAVREFGQELWLLVVNHVLIASGKCDLDTTESGGGLDLKRYWYEVTVFGARVMSLQPCPWPGSQSSKEFLKVPFCQGLGWKVVRDQKR